LFQAVREALFNVAKHTGTLQAFITLEKSNGNIQLAIRDQGAGFLQDEIMNQGNGHGGLDHMKRRLKLIDCRLHVHSQPGKGTEVIIDIPSELVNT